MIQLAEPKTCLSCKTVKTTADFWGRGRGKLRARCKKCELERRRPYMQRYFVENRARIGEYRRLQLEERPDELRERQKHYLRKFRYGITREQYEALVEKQRGLCAICGRAQERLVVDHDHSSNRVRGLLCNGCNVVLGHAEDSPKTLLSAAAYLTRTADTQ